MAKKERVFSPSLSQLDWCVTVFCFHQNNPSLEFYSSLPVWRGCELFLSFHCKCFGCRIQRCLWVLNSRTNIGCFCKYLSEMDKKYFNVVFTLNQTLNSLKNKHILSNLQKHFCCFNKLFSYWQNFLSFFAGYEIWFWF